MQRSDTGRREKHEHIEIKFLILGEIVGHSAVHHTLRVLQFLGIKHFLDFVAMYVAQRNQIILGLVLGHYFHELRPFSG